MKNFKNLQNNKRQNDKNQQINKIFKIKEQPLISIITPTYKRPNLLPMCIESVDKQIYQNWEHIIVIEEISKEYLKIIEKYKNSKRKFIINDKRRGSGKSRDIAINSSNGSIIAYIDDDDLFYKDHLSSRCKSFFEYDFVYGPHIDTQKSYYKKDKIENYDIRIYCPGFYSFIRLQSGNFLTPVSVCHTRDVYNKTEGFCNEYLEDWELWKRISLQTNKFFLLNKITCETRHFLNELRGPTF